MLMWIYIEMAKENSIQLGDSIAMMHCYEWFVNFSINSNLTEWCVWGYWKVYIYDAIWGNIKLVDDMKFNEVMGLHRIRENIRVKWKFKAYAHSIMRARARWRDKGKSGIKYTNGNEYPIESIKS